MKAGPQPERPVTASMCFSSTTTVRPTVANRNAARSSCSWVANRPRLSAAMPAPSIDGVFGIARTTPISIPAASSMAVVRTEAAIEISSFCGVSEGRICLT